VVRRLAELDRLDAALGADLTREEALKGDASHAIDQLEQERRAIEQRLDDAESHAARLGQELTAAETASRDAEAALAELLARQAAMRAERRVAEAALEAAKAHWSRAEQEGQCLEQQLTVLGDGAEHSIARDSAGNRSRAAAAALAQAEDRRVEAEQGRDRAAEQRDAAESALASARAAFSAAKSEHDALARALDQGGSGVIANLKAEPGFERALAAALGEDTEASIGKVEAPRRWEGSERLAGDPPLPPGVACLADHV